jgi:hypothetical protein
MSGDLSSADNLTVKALVAAREVLAPYTLEEFSVEPVVTLPPDYTVGLSTVETDHGEPVHVLTTRKFLRFTSYQCQAHLTAESA